MLPTRVFPGVIRPGDTVGVVSPSSPITPRLQEGIEWLQNKGFEVVVGPHVWNRRGVLAGTDEERLSDLHNMFADPQIDAVLASGGGYGTHRLLLRGLDFELLAANPKPFVGFSDITGLHVALWNKLGWVTVHGPNVSSLPRVSQKAQEAWLKTMTGRTPLELIEPPLEPYSVIVRGSVKGPIVGGNLALVSTLIGTPYDLDTRGAILFLENVDDRAYRFDRYLAMLRMAGKIRDCAGVIVGTSVDLTSTGSDGHSTMAEILEEHLVAEGKPAIYGFPAGHMKNNFAFPLGVRVKLDATDPTAPDVRFVESLLG